MTTPPKGGMIIPATFTEEYVKRLLPLFPHLEAKGDLYRLNANDRYFMVGMNVHEDKLEVVVVEHDSTPGAERISILTSRVVIDKQGTLVENLWVHPQEVLDKVIEDITNHYNL